MAESSPRFVAVVVAVAALLDPLLAAPVGLAARLVPAVPVARVLVGVSVPVGEAAAAAGVLEGVPVPVPEAAAAAGVLEGVPVPLGVSVPGPEAAANAGVLEGVPVPVADAGAAAGVAEADAAAPGAGRLACHSPVHALYSVGQAELPLCWQHVKRGAAALRGLKCTK